MNQLRRFVKNIATGMMVNESIVEANTSNEDWSSPWVGGIQIEPEYSGLVANKLNINLMILANKNLGIDNDPMTMVDIEAVLGFGGETHGFFVRNVKVTSLTAEVPKSVLETVRDWAGMIANIVCKDHRMEWCGQDGVEFRSADEWNDWFGPISKGHI